jgi:hypothetical protein
MDPNIVQLLKLLKDLLPPGVYEAIIPMIIGMMESTDAVLHRRMAQILMEWVRTHYPQLEKLMEMTLRQAAPGSIEGGTAATATALTAAQVVAILCAVLAVAFAAWSIYSEYKTQLYTPVVPVGGGSACNSLTPGGQYMARMYRSVSVWGWGSKSTLNKAIREAEALCNADAAKCGSGGCSGGLGCKPDVAIQDVQSFNGFFATRVVLGFTCPCVCK